MNSLLVLTEMSKSNDYESRSVWLRKDQIEWLKSNHLNFSSLARDVLDRYRRKVEKMEVEV